MAEERYSINNKGTSPALSHLLNEYAKMPRSTFNENRRKYFDAFPYAIIPVECFQMLPNSDVTLSYDVSVLAKNPTLRRVMSGCSVELATYRVAHNNDMWEAWNNFITRGRSGKVDLSIPHVDFGLGNSAQTSLLPYSPYAYMNIVPSVFLGGTDDEDVNKWSVEANSGVQSINSVQLSGLSGLTKNNWYFSDALKVSALPGVMYCKVAKQFQNPNLLQGNSSWYPENENHDLILPYDLGGDSSSSQGVTTADYDHPKLVFDSTKHQVRPNEVAAHLGTTDKKGSAPWLNVLYYKQRRGNYFNTGSPFPDLIRGDMPTLDVLSATLDTSRPAELLRQFYSGSYIPYYVNGVATYPGLPTSDSTGYRPVIGVSVDGQGFKRIFVDRFSNSSSNFTSQGSTTEDTVFTSSGTPWDELVSALSSSTVSGLQFNLNQWRRLAALTVFRERMARTDGSYNQLIQAQFQWNPKWHEHDVIYCGGSTQPIVFSDVVQTSGDSEGSPLGTTGGRAVSAMQNEQIKIHSDDFSMFMTVLTITPDDVYSQGVERVWSELEQSQQYFPILNNLEPQAILNKELFVSGDNSVDEDIFNYQERFAHLKSRRNQASGLMCMPIGSIGDTGAWIFNRLFGSTPQFNQSFVEGHFTDNEERVFAGMAQAQFVVTVSSQLSYTAPIPAVTAPSDMGISY